MSGQQLVVRRWWWWRCSSAAGAAARQVCWSAARGGAEAESVASRELASKALRQCMYATATSRCTAGVRELSELSRWRDHRHMDVRRAAMSLSSRSAAAAATATSTSTSTARSEEDDAREQWENVLASVVKVYTGVCMSLVKYK